MPRILIAECKQEVSTFNPHLSLYEDFTVRRGQDILAYHRQIRNEIGGALSVFQDFPEIELVPAFSALSITSGGTLSERSWERISNEFLEEIRQAIATGPLDGV